jgi:hypothetical protein
MVLLQKMVTITIIALFGGFTMKKMTIAMSSPFSMLVVL